MKENNNTTQNITLAFSPCPNDTFIFDALVHEKIDTEGLHFDYCMQDVETLNQAAFGGQYDVSKLSFHAFYHVLSTYACLTSGSALCDNFGPVLIGKKGHKKHDIEKLTVAVPGMYTSAALIFNHFFKAQALVPFLFSDIEQIVLDGKADLGIIIHENVFTYEEKGLVEVVNLGKLWSSAYKMPIPLGCIAVKRSLPTDIQLKINRLIRKSIAFAFENPLSSRDFVKQNAVNLSDRIIKKHIETYVNHYSIELNADAKKVIQFLYEDLLKKRIINSNKIALFAGN